MGEQFTKNVFQSNAMFYKGMIYLINDNVLEEQTSQLFQDEKLINICTGVLNVKMSYMQTHLSDS
jgi:hypothetical protein